MISEEELSKLADEAWENSDHDCDYLTFVHTYEQGFTKALEKIKDLAVERGKCSCNWISVTDEPPKEGGEYLISDGTASTVDIWLCGIGWRDPDNNERVTHWMPMPLAPTKKEGEK